MMQMLLVQEPHCKPDRTCKAQPCLAASSRSTTLTPPTALAVAFFLFSQMNQLHSCSRAFAQAVSLAWNFLPSDILISRSFLNISANMLLPCPPNLIGPLATLHQIPCFIFILFIYLFICVNLFLVCFPHQNTSSLRAETMTVSFNNT